MFAIQEIQNLQKFCVVKCLSRRDAFNRGLGVNYRYSDTPNFKNAISMDKMSQVQKFDTGQSILTDEVLQHQIEQARSACESTQSEPLPEPKPDESSSV